MNWSKIGFTLLCSLWIFSAWAQPVATLPTNPAEFLTALTTEFDKTHNKDAEELSIVLVQQWKGTSYSPEDKQQAVEQINAMLTKKYAIVPEVYNYVKALTQVKRMDAYVKMVPKEFFEVSGRCIADLDKKRLNTYLKAIAAYIPQGNLVTRSNYFWHVSQNVPKLYFLEIKGKTSTYQAPVLQFKGATLRYVSKLDSSAIRNTSGDYNLLSNVFTGSGGNVDWMKMQIPQAYCNFKTYKISTNGGIIQADSVTFHYPGVIDRPLKGRFEDRNFGFKDPSQANFPYFRSYEGGVQIKNLVRNASYEGGFSLRGVRKIGSAYDIWVDSTSALAPAYMPKPKPKKEKVVVKAPPTTEEAIAAVYNEYDFEEVKEEETKNMSKSDEGWDLDWGAMSSGYKEEEYSDEVAISDPVEPTPEQIEESRPPGKVLKHIKAKIIMQHNDKKIMQFEADEFVIDLERINSKMVEAKVYTGKDSITHPGCDLVYNVDDHKVILKKNKKSIYSRQPFTSSYHAFYLYFESIEWEVGTDNLKFTSFIDKENKTSAVESFDYFNKDRFDQFKGISKIHPIGAIYRFTYEHAGEPILPESIIKAYAEKTDLDAFKKSLPLLEGSGYIRYDHKTLLIKPELKLYNWGKAARKKKDFDIIQLVSAIETGDNANMDINSQAMKMNGVQPFAISDSQLVRAVPLDNQITIGKNRNFSFGGTMAAGKLNYYGNKSDQFKFDYESYKVGFDNLDSIRFILVRNPPPDYQFTPLEKALRGTVFENVTGAIHIDDPSNKNGEKDYPYFPVFDSYSKSYVYWAKDGIQGGVYEKSKLKFILDPFVMDSLMTFNERALRFEGSFNTSNIFPEFRQTLAVMEDNTLGLKHTTPEEGMKVFEGKGTFYSDIRMDGFGLHGNGKLDYLGTHSLADTFVFHFDDVIANVKTFDQAQDAKYPKIHGENLKYKWSVKEDKLDITTTGKAIELFDGQGLFEGTLTITPEGVTGNGKLTVGQVVVTSDNIKLSPDKFNTQGGEFAIIDQTNPKVKNFHAENVKIDYNITQHTSRFTANKPGEPLGHFAPRNFHTSLMDGIYERDSNLLYISGSSPYVEKNYFISVQEDDTLHFLATKAKYDINTQLIHVEGVTGIEVADALIAPEKNELIIEQTGAIRKLENAIIVANKTDKFHKIYESSVNILSANDYEGKGKYDYITVDDKAQYIQFNNIEVQKGVSVASGEIAESQNFFLTDRIRFRGTANLNASKKFLSFDGEVLIDSDNPAFRGSWFEFKYDDVNPDSVFIPIKDQMTNEAGEELTVGLNFINEYRLFYSNFLQPKKNQDDKVLLSASGGLTFDRKTQEFRIGSQEKLTGKTNKGSTVSFNEKKNTIVSQGLINMPYEFKKNTATVKMSGRWKEDLKKREMSTDLVMSVNFGAIFPVETSKKLVELTRYQTGKKKDSEWTPVLYEHLSDIVVGTGKKEDKTMYELERSVKNAMTNDDIKLEKILPSTFAISGVDFHYSNDYKALFSDSDINLLTLNGTTIAKKVSAKVVYQLGPINDQGLRDPDKLTVLIEFDDYNWIYYHFEDNSVRFACPFNDDVMIPMQVELDKMKKKPEDFQVVLTNGEEVSSFKQNFIKKFFK